MTLEVRAAEGEEWGICQSPFIRHRVSVSGDTLSYDETTVLEIYGRRFDHTDANELTRA